MTEPIQPGVWHRLTETCKPDDGECVLMMWPDGLWSVVYRCGDKFDIEGNGVDLSNYTHWLRIPPAPEVK